MTGNGQEKVLVLPELTFQLGRQTVKRMSGNVVDKRRVNSEQHK